ncbi:MAG: dihydrofolate reductase [Sphingobacteriales bacterium]|jgi:dihydrofolate reductase|nr:dihydrofolate reductase [Sphingobacteriales bacterium]
MNISIIVAAAENGVIGKDNRLLWKLSSDLKRFKNITTGHFIVMGRKTFESIGNPLPNRTSLIISSNFRSAFENCLVFPTINEAIVYAAKQQQDEIFVVGGGEIYRQTLPLANKIHLTIVHTEIEGDTHFDYDDSNWVVKHKEFVPKDEKNEFDSTYIILQRTFD